MPKVSPWDFRKNFSICFLIPHLILTEHFLGYMWQSLGLDVILLILVCWFFSLDYWHWGVLYSWFFFFFTVCLLNRITDKLLSEPLDRSIFSLILLLLASFGTVYVVLLKSDYWWATEAKVAFPFLGGCVWLSECLTLDPCNHGHVYEKSPFGDSCICFPCGYMCEMHFNL